MDRNKIIKRLLMVSGLNGFSIAIFAGLSILVCFFAGSGSGVAISLAIAASGYMELTGRKKLDDKTPDSQKWLVASQLWLMGILISYALYKLLSFDPAEISVLLSPEMQTLIENQISLTPEAFTEIVIRIYNAIYITVIAATTVYQGGLCYFYWKNTETLFKNPAPPETPIQ